MAIISVSNLSYEYSNSDRKAVDDVSFDIEQGDWVAIVGHNGSGKSTLAKLLIGLMAADEGTITIDGLELTEETVWDIREKVGMVFQNPDNQFVGATVADDVAFGMENRQMDRATMRERVTSALTQVDMLDYVDREPAKLSGGQKQRVALAGIIAIVPKILILDEATSMLDPKGRREILATIKALKTKYDLTVLSITHDIDEAASADHILMIDDGHFVEEADPEKIFSHGAQLIQMGLDVPFAEKVKRALATRGVDTPQTYMDEGSLADWLWKSRLKK
ncbi:energy-coupling factor transporter ATPase [Secundilactobacillus paracollinoides]|uniref:Energy-coupling factor transporter ATPase n=1 Tax=Secundilactobacillus paracollinoides TaxID=240427 RepID=A0A1B2IZJ5_9LACO|nr:energy-coupling factor ABC transporter ATP-binding protein [Secundilactobacillus paracollinoides]ANZ61489.1 energy-coupling factor transporter ATPase [Secundilactobacillus paracollinoides]ANZ64121.1 energy-coupling factor transporter ATPase [Secundilactobacillus paracollinoides]ANZ67410.1 energy-coupling factor transporter ATPase [Secundilactobacillus paracollinoides]